MRLALCVARALTDCDCSALLRSAPMSVRAISQGHNMSAEKIRLTVIHWVQIAIGAIYLLNVALIPFLTGRSILERFVWVAVFGLLPGLCIIAACVRKR
jgi:hypothetical protein